MDYLVEFCTNNYVYGTDRIKKSLEGNEEYEVMEYNCLGHCTECDITPFAVVEGEFVEADTLALLKDMIKEKIQEKKAMDHLFDQIIDEENN